MLFVLFLLIGLLILKKARDKKVKRDEEKVRYIDPLTSLKNRNYLNLNINRWDENKVYPQAIIIVDLNGLKGINNEHSYKEGDRVIKSAANILINNQLKNTDIMRTDGNEFMIYAVGYNEEQITLYVRKLYKLMKELPYEKGASLGKSMILDDIKLIEDAINEAVLEAKNNKEK
jgi:diguanylate cyclase (GGDEF)-like protein